MQRNSVFSVGSTVFWLTVLIAIVRKLSRRVLTSLVARDMYVGGATICCTWVERPSVPSVRIRPCTVLLFTNYRDHFCAPYFSFLRISTVRATLVKVPVSAAPLHTSWSNGEQSTPAHTMTTEPGEALGL
jgi:hypothetical protein